MVKYYQRYTDETKARPITKKQALTAIDKNYINGETLLDQSSKEKPLRTPFAYYWIE